MVNATQLLEIASREEPLLLLFEDIHAAEVSNCCYWQRVVCAASACCLGITYRGVLPHSPSKLKNCSRKLIS